jgi:hypothetical protein
LSVEGRLRQRWYINRHDDSPPSDIACCVEERRKQVRAFGDCVVRVIEQLLRKRDHRLRRREPQVGRVEVTEADAVEAGSRHALDRN